MDQTTVTYMNGTNAFVGGRFQSRASNSYCSRWIRSKQSPNANAFQIILGFVHSRAIPGAETIPTGNRRKIKIYCIICQRIY